MKNGRRYLRNSERSSTKITRGETPGKENKLKPVLACIFAAKHANDHAKTPSVFLALSVSLEVTPTVRVSILIR